MPEFRSLFDATDLFTCDDCGAVVTARTKGVHDDWHGKSKRRAPAKKKPS